MIKQFRRKPVVIEAIQFDGTNKEEIQNFVGDEIGQDVNSKDLFITTLEGIMIASVGDYIIKGVQGEFYPCKPDIFEQTYNEVQENTSDLITEVNVTELLKIAEQSEQQYNAVVKQNKELQSELREVRNENFLLKDAFETYKKDNERFEQALKKIAELNKDCADCSGSTCGVCSVADYKPNNSYKIANDALNGVQNG